MKTIIVVAAALILAGCSKPAEKWDYKEVEGDQTTLELYGRYGWELVSSAPDPGKPNWTKYTLKRVQGTDDQADEGLAETKDQGRVFEAQMKEIDGK
jgi:hypothetical protein